MKRGRLLAAAIAVLFAPARVFAWEIARFDTQVAVHADSTATVTETITADFFGEQRHGIYRDIPIHYTDRAGQHFRLRLRVLDVTDGQGQSWRYRLESFGRYQRVRIGDPDRTWSGPQTYRLVYEVQRGAIRFFPDHDECYWNLTGNEWAVPIREVSAAILLPRPVNQLRVEAFIGGYGSTERLTATETLPDGVRFKPARPFDPYEGLTAAVAWERGVVHPPSAWRVLGWWLEDNWVYGLPGLVLLGMLWLWSVRGRDPALRRSEVVEYDPPDHLTPGEMGTLWDERADVRDITATIIDLAVRGYLRITPQESAFLGMMRTTDYELVSLKPWKNDTSLKPHEQSLLKGLFGSTPDATTTLSELERVFYEALPGIRHDLIRSVIAAGYLDSNPDTVRSAYLFLGTLLSAGMLWALIALTPWHHLGTVPLAVASVLSGLIVAAFSPIMPRRTRKGADCAGRIAGFIEFLRRTDQDRLRRLNDSSLFERGLPYALAFGVAAQWARNFEGLYLTPPTWYAGRWDAFSPRGFARDLDHTTASMGRALSATPRAGGSSGSWGGSGGGGGGFSGGGGGGGGGGAW